MDWEVVIAAPLVGAWNGYSVIRCKIKAIAECSNGYEVGAELEIKRRKFILCTTTTTTKK